MVRGTPRGRRAVHGRRARPSGSGRQIRKVDHTGITVASLADSLEFWVGVLGFKHLYTTRFPNDPFIENVVGVPGAALVLAMVEGPGHSIELLEYSAPGERHIMKPRSCDVGSVHVALLVDDLDALLDRMKQAGWNPVGTPQTVVEGERAGLRLVYVRGPDGATVELLQPGPGAVSSPKT
ncbi:VOC family protein [Saccharopolyspora sp. 5N708]|uniref:VOC family protein n=1 Tax=Saccharopolyspora sp. 5N708 TaxID=3457424 RepID=UPI003FD28C3D